MANPWTIARTTRVATALQLPTDEVETATNLAECIRLSQQLQYPKEKSFPPALAPYAMDVMKDPTILSRKGTKTAAAFSKRELLLLLALYLLVSLPSEAVNIFVFLSPRSASAVKEKLASLIARIPKD